MEKKGNAKEVGWFLVQKLEILISAHACDLVALNSFLNVKLEGFCVNIIFINNFIFINNILGKVDPRIVIKWHKRVQNAMLSKKCKSGLCGILGFLL